MTEPIQTDTQRQGAKDLKNTAVLSIGHGVVMALGGVLALLIAHYFGKDQRTDALFTAYGVYGLAVIFGQTLRLTAIPRLVSEHDWEMTDRLVAAILAITLIAAVPMIAFADPLGRLLAPGDPGVAASSLRLLWPAVAGQLIIGLLAAVLVVHGRFSVIGMGYSVSGVMSIVVFLALESTAGIKAIPLSLGASSLSVAAMFIVALLRSGWRPRIHDYIDLRTIVGDCAGLGFASASFVANNLGYVIALAIVARLGEGEATVYAYAYFTTALFVATTAVSAAMARAPGMLEHVDPTAAAASSAVTGYRFTLVVLTPVFALAATVGPQVLDVLLGPQFSDGDASQLVSTLFALSGWVFASAAGVFAVVHLLNERRFGALALIALVQTAILPVLGILGRELGTEGVAAAQSTSLIVATVAQLVLAFGGGVRWMAANTLRAAIVCGISVLPGIAIAELIGESLPALALTAAAVIAIAIVATSVAWREEFRVLTAALRELMSQSAAPAT